MNCIVVLKFPDICYHIIDMKTYQGEVCDAVLDRDCHASVHIENEGMQFVW